jgi:hypothetical protein
VQPEKIKFLIDPQPDHNSSNKIIFLIKSNESIKINIEIIERIGFESNIQIKNIYYDDYELKDINKFCSLYKNNKSFKTHGYIDEGVFRIKIQTNPISQHFLEYLIDKCS